MRDLSIYIHIPFCVSKCSYCDFCSFVASPEVMGSYVRALCAEIVQKSTIYSDRRIQTIYIGGGTPSFLPPGAIEKILACVRQNFCLDPAVNISIEANPNSFSPQKASEYMRAGCQRISFGLQAIEPAHLQMLGRRHSWEDCVRAVSSAREAGIVDTNIDILLGIPTQTIWDVHELLDRVTALPITHISAYSLIQEPDTPLTHKILAGELKAPDDLDVVNMYDFTVDYLAKKGFAHYEISNFAKPGFESLHNLNYWRRGEYLGLGLGAFSFVDGVHWENTSGLSAYLADPTDAGTNFERETLLTAKEEFIMLALRTTRGLSIAEYDQRFGADFLAEHRQSLDYLCNRVGLLRIQDGYVIPTNFYLTNTIISHLFEFK